MASAAPPLALSTQNGVTTLSGTVAGWTLGARTLAFSENKGPLTRGKIDAAGVFQIALPAPAQLKTLIRKVGDLYDVVGCDDQPSDFDISGREAALYWLPRLSVAKARPNPKAPYERGEVYNLTNTGKDELWLLYSSAFTTIRVDVFCSSFGSERGVIYNLNLAPGWNMVLDRVGNDTDIRDAPGSLETRWMYGVR
ncbi:hypothetical protein ACFFLM_01920 [Deinococcus oregonensis]|uniref:Uncharacterized protein n=1 Tax=Deinococcus oregonensis TaxID=1805970 RepID=A0ABV6AVT4_9DEIO